MHVVRADNERFEIIAIYTYAEKEENCLVLQSVRNDRHNKMGASGSLGAQTFTSSCLCLPLNVHFEQSFAGQSPKYGTG